MDILLDSLELYLDISFLAILLIAVTGLVVWQGISDWRRGWVTRASLGLMVGSTAAYWLFTKMVHMSPGWQMVVLVLWAVITVAGSIRLENWLRSRVGHPDSSNEV